MANATAASEQIARRLLRYGGSDEDVERLSGLNLQHIIALRAEAAAKPASEPYTLKSAEESAFAADWRLEPS